MAFSKLISLGCLIAAGAALFLFSPRAYGQGGPSSSTAVKTDGYPDNPGGLKRLVKDIMRAQKENDSARAGALLDSLVLPNNKQWYSENFDDGAVPRVLPKYQAMEKTLPAQLARFFLDSQAQGLNDVETVRFEKDCDDNANEQTFNTLDARLKPFPLYEVRLFQGNQFKRLFAFAYVDGGFRFVLTPDFSDGPLRGNKPSGTQTGENEKLEPRIRQGGAVQAALLLKKVSPNYPDIARNERLSGTVRLHAIIDKDGKVSELRVLTGRCSLAKASVEAVRQWRYRPTLFNGQPVEVDTTIDVIFQINQ